VYEGRTEGMNKYKQRFAVETDARTLADAMRGADVFYGLSVANLLSPEMVKTMTESPLIFALANPDPEIKYELAREARPDAIVATGRSDYPNQINNVLGFPFIFRGALDVRARAINEEMKMAATRALAALAKEDVPDAVNRAYGLEHRFGANYLIPKPFDPRVLLWVAPAVAWAAVTSGAAPGAVDVEEYRAALEARLGRARAVMRGLATRAAKNPRRIVFPEGEDPRIVRAARILVDEGSANPVLLGNDERLRQVAT